MTVLETTHRGTTNANARGNTEDRRRRRQWLIETYRADVDLICVVRHFALGEVETEALQPAWRGHVDSLRAESLGRGHLRTEATLAPACRCYRCGTLLIDRLGPDGWPAPYTLTVDRIIPGCRGGTYRRSNIRPACGQCNSETGGPLARRSS